jgi:hypothetical protein
MGRRIDRGPRDRHPPLPRRGAERVRHRLDRRAHRDHLHLRAPRLAGWLLLAAAGWTAFLWIGRLVNLARDDDHDAGFIAVHMGLGIVSLILAVPVAIVGWRLRAGRSAL